MRGGNYFLPATEMLTAADSGTATTKVVYENYAGEAPVFSGGMRVTSWTNTSCNTWKTTLPALRQTAEFQLPDAEMSSPAKRHSAAFTNKSEHATRADHISPCGARL